jgi:hypothetical protein
MVHCVYGIYHLGRNPAKRSPASSATYMFFAALADVSLLPFYAFSALMSESQYKLALGGTDQKGEWTTLLPTGQALTTKLAGTAFLLAVVSGGFHLVSLGMSLWLAVTFRKLTKLPPDMDPFDEDLPSRHQRNKSSVSTFTLVDKRASSHLESMRNSGAPYEELERPPTIPFLNTRNSSSDSLSSAGESARGSVIEPANRRQPYPRSHASARSSRIKLDPPKSQNPSTPSTPPSPPKHFSRPLSQPRDSWFSADSLKLSTTPKAAVYHALDQDQEQESSNEENFLLHPKKSGTLLNHPNPLEENPPAPNFSRLQTNSSNALMPVAANRGPAKAQVAEETTVDITESPRHGYNTRSRAPSPSQYSESNYSISDTRSENSNVNKYGDLTSTRNPRDQRSSVPIGIARQISSGNDYDLGGGGRAVRGYRRDVSGKVAEEGRGNDGQWGPRFRKVSGIQ